MIFYKLTLSEVEGVNVDPKVEGLEGKLSGIWCIAKFNYVICILKYLLLFIFVETWRNNYKVEGFPRLQDKYELKFGSTVKNN